MIEAGEPIYNCIAIGLGLFVTFLLGIVWGNVSSEVENERKKSN